MGGVGEGSKAGLVGLMGDTFPDVSEIQDVLCLQSPKGGHDFWEERSLKNTVQLCVSSQRFKYNSSLLMGRTGLYTH